MSWALWSRDQFVVAEVSLPMCVAGPPVATCLQAHAAAPEKGLPFTGPQAGRGLAGQVGEKGVATQPGERQPGLAPGLLGCVLQEADGVGGPATGDLLAPPSSRELLHRIFLSLPVEGVSLICCMRSGLQ